MPVHHHVSEYDLIAKEERRLSDVMIGYLDPADHVPSAAEVAAAREAGTDDTEEEVDTGPDPVEAKKRFTAIRRQHNKTEKAIADKGRNSKEAMKEMDKS